MSDLKKILGLLPFIIALINLIMKFFGDDEDKKQNKVNPKTKP